MCKYIHKREHKNLTTVRTYIQLITSEKKNCSTIRYTYRVQRLDCRVCHLGSLPFLFSDAIRKLLLKCHFHPGHFPPPKLSFVHLCLSCLPFVCLPVCLFVYLFVCLFVWLFVCLFVRVIVLLYRHYNVILVTMGEKRVTSLEKKEGSKG